MKRCTRCGVLVSKVFQKNIDALEDEILCPNCYNEVILNINDWIHSRLALFEIKKWLKISFEWTMRFLYVPNKDVLLKYSHNMFILFLRVYKRSFARSLGLDIPDVTNIYNSNDEDEAEVDRLINKNFDLRFEKINDTTYKFIIFSDSLFSIKEYMEQRFSINRANKFLCEKNKINLKNDYSAFLVVHNEPYHKHIMGCLNMEYSIRNRIRYFLLDKESEDEFFEDQSFDNFLKKINTDNFKHSIAKGNPFVIKWISETIKIYLYEKNMFKLKLLDIVKM